jgi:hypothetical protein
MKKIILSKLKKIEKLADETGMQGTVNLEFDNCSISDWDSAIESIVEYPRNKHFIQVTPKLLVTLLLN